MRSGVFSFTRVMRENSFFIEETFGVINYENQEYIATQINFKYPSEHLLNNIRYSLEIQLIAKDEAILLFSTVSAWCIVVKFTPFSIISNLFNGKPVCSFIILKTSLVIQIIFL